MPKTIPWIGRHLSFGGLLRDLGCSFGLMIQLLMQGSGAVVTLFVRNPQTKQTVTTKFTVIGQSINTTLTNSSAMVGCSINYGFQKCSSAIGFVSGGVAKIVGASEENTLLARKLGTVFGAVIFGVIAGVGVANATVAIAAPKTR